MDAYILSFGVMSSQDDTKVSPHGLSQGPPGSKDQVLYTGPIWVRVTPRQYGKK